MNLVHTDFSSAAFDMTTKRQYYLDAYSRYWRLCRLYTLHLQSSRSECFPLLRYAVRSGENAYYQITTIH